MELPLRKMLLFWFFGLCWVVSSAEAQSVSNLPACAVSISSFTFALMMLIRPAKMSVHCVQRRDLWSERPEVYLHEPGFPGQCHRMRDC